MHSRLSLLTLSCRRISSAAACIHTQKAAPLGCVARTAVGWKKERGKYSLALEVRVLCIAEAFSKPTRAAVDCGYREESNHFCASSWLEVNFEFRQIVRQLSFVWDEIIVGGYDLDCQAKRLVVKELEFPSWLHRASRSRDQGKSCFAALCCDIYFKFSFALLREKIVAFKNKLDTVSYVRKSVDFHAASLRKF